MSRRLSLADPGSHLAPAGALIMRAAVSLALLMVCLAGGCSDRDRVISPPSNPFTLPRTSPENVLYNFRSIYDGADSFVKTVADTLQWGDMYQSLFLPDTFRFYFVITDQPPWLSDPWWGLADEVHSLKSMLRKKALGTINDIELTWTATPSEPDLRSGGDPPHLLHPTWRHITVTGILLDVVEGLNTYRVPNGSADFYFAPDPASPSLWVISEWYDHPPAGGSGSPPGRAASATASSITGITWGAIKGLFYY